MWPNHTLQSMLTRFCVCKCKIMCVCLLCQTHDMWVLYLPCLVYLSHHVFFLYGLLNTKSLLYRISERVTCCFTISMKMCKLKTSTLNWSGAWYFQFLLFRSFSLFFVTCTGYGFNIPSSNGTRRIKKLIESDNALQKKGGIKRLWTICIDNCRDGNIKPTEHRYGVESVATTTRRRVRPNRLKSIQSGNCDNTIIFRYTHILFVHTSTYSIAHSYVNIQL